VDFSDRGDFDIARDVKLPTIVWSGPEASAPAGIDDEDRAPVAAPTPPHSTIRRPARPVSQHDHGNLIADFRRYVSAIIMRRHPGTIRVDQEQLPARSGRKDSRRSGLRKEIHLCAFLLDRHRRGGTARGPGRGGDVDIRCEAGSRLGLMSRGKLPATGGHQ
jgi:hypothetical protein